MPRQPVYSYSWRQAGEPAPPPALDVPALIAGRPAIWLPDFDFARPATSGLSRLFETASPLVTADAAVDNIGLVLEESEDATIGADFITNGDFATGDLTGWTDEDTGTGASTYSGGMRLVGPDNSNRGRRTQTFTPGIGFVRVTITATVVSGSAGIQIGTASNSSTGGGVLTPVGAGTTVGVINITSAATMTITIQSTGNADVTITSVVVEPIEGHHAVQTTTGNRPTVQLEGSRYKLRFDGTNDALLTDFIPDATNGMLAGRVKGSQQSRFFIGASQSSPTTQRCHVGMTTEGYFGAGFGANTLAGFNQGSVDRRNTDFAGALVWDATTLTLVVNGAVVATTSRNGDPPSTTALAIGANSSAGTPGNFWTGDIDSILAINGAISVQDACDVTNYLMSL